MQDYCLELININRLSLSKCDNLIFGQHWMKFLMVAHDVLFVHITGLSCDGLMKNQRNGVGNEYSLINIKN